jgi:solute carrier family 25 phosphate transporter 23/24/25/41
VNCIKVMPETAVKMFVFDFAKSWANSDPNLVSGPQRFVAGGFAGAVSQVMVYPLEVIKTRLSVSPPSLYTGVLHCFSKTLTLEGVGALYRGCATSVVGIIPYAGIDLMMSSMLRDACVRYYDASRREPGPLTMLGVGVLSGTAAMTLTYPIGLVRTRLQASGLPGTEKWVAGTFDGCFEPSFTLSLQV